MTVVDRPTAREEASLSVESVVGSPADVTDDRHTAAEHDDRRHGRAPGRPRDEILTRAITDAALGQLAELGYSRMSMESVASAARVARATVYRRYKDKADLVTAAIAGNRGGHFPAHRSASPRQDLVTYLEEFDARFGAKCIEIVGTLLGSNDERGGLALHRERVVEPRTAYARELLARAQELGQLHGEVDLDLCVQMLAGSVFARSVCGVSSPTGWARRAVDIIWREPEADGIVEGSAD